jgi:anti-sigma factor RsiW
MQSLQHRQIWDLIPWLVNGTASAADRIQAEAHLAICPDCRDEFAFQSRVHAGVAVDTIVDVDAQPALQKLLARIDHDESIGGAPRSAPAPRRLASNSKVRWLAAAVVVQALGLGALGAWTLQHSRAISQDAAYRTLSAPEALAAGATIRFVPSPELSVGSMQRLLSANGLHVVGTNEGGTIYSLAPVATATPSGATGETLAHLRAAPGVLLAEPIASTSNAR